MSTVIQLVTPDLPEPILNAQYTTVDNAIVNEMKKTEPNMGYVTKLRSILDQHRDEIARRSLKSIITQETNKIKEDTKTIKEDFTNVKSMLSETIFPVAKKIRVYPSLDDEPYAQRLEMSQFEVFDKTGENVAINKPTFATSTAANQTANRKEVVVDGERDEPAADTTINYWSVGDSGIGIENEYWEVDLGDNYPIKRLVYIGVTSSGPDSELMKNKNKGVRIVLIDKGGDIVSEILTSTTETKQILSPLKNMTVAPPILPVVSKVRVRPSILTDDPERVRLSIAQLQVIDTTGANVALKKQTFATSTLSGSGGKDVPVNGLRDQPVPDETPLNYWHIGPGDSITDYRSEFWEVDLCGNFPLKEIVYIGRSRGDLIKRNKGILIELLNSAGGVITSLTTPTEDGKQVLKVPMRRYGTGDNQPDVIDSAGAIMTTTDKYYCSGTIPTSPSTTYTHLVKYTTYNTTVGNIQYIVGTTLGGAARAYDAKRCVKLVNGMVITGLKDRNGSEMIVGESYFVLDGANSGTGRLVNITTEPINGIGTVTFRREGDNKEFSCPSNNAVRNSPGTVITGLKDRNGSDMIIGESYFFWDGTNSGRGRIANIAFNQSGGETVTFRRESDNSLFSCPPNNAVRNQAGTVITGLKDRNGSDMIVGRFYHYWSAAQLFSGTGSIANINIASTQGGGGTVTFRRSDNTEVSCLPNMCAINQPGTIIDATDRTGSKMIIGQTYTYGTGAAAKRIVLKDWVSTATNIWGSSTSLIIGDDLNCTRRPVARYVVVRPSLTATDAGFFAFSQIQVFDAAGTNVAFNKPVTTNCSLPITSPIMAGGTTGPPSVVVNVSQQMATARTTLADIWHAGKLNVVPPTTSPSTTSDIIAPSAVRADINASFLTIDLGQEIEIRRIRFVGRGDSTTYDARNYGIRFELRDANNYVTRLVKTASTVPPTTKVEDINIPILASTCDSSIVNTAANLCSPMPFMPLTRRVRIRTGTLVIGGAATSTNNGLGLVQIRILDNTGTDRAFGRTVTTPSTGGMATALSSSTFSSGPMSIITNSSTVKTANNTNGSFWQAAGGTTRDAYIEIDLGGEFPIEEIQYVARGANNSEVHDKNLNVRFEFLNSANNPIATAATQNRSVVQTVIPVPVATGVAAMGGGAALANNFGARQLSVAVGAGQRIPRAPALKYRVTLKRKGRGRRTTHKRGVGGKV